MDTTYLSLTALSMTGILAGALIAWAASEEIHAGKKYLKFAKHASFIIGLLLTVMESGMIVLTAAALLAFVINQKKASYSFIFPILMYFIRHSTMIIALSSLAFFYFLTEVSLNVGPDKKVLYKKIIPDSSYLFVALAVAFIA